MKKSDTMCQRALERKRGERTAKPPKQAICCMVYGYYRTAEGCLADKDALGIVRNIYQSALEGMKPTRIARNLNAENVSTPYQFFISHGDKGRKEKNHTWDGDKVEGILTNERYVKECPYREICRSEGRHCERKPLVPEDGYRKALEVCGHWQSRRKAGGKGGGGEPGCHVYQTDNRENKADRIK